MGSSNTTHPLTSSQPGLPHVRVGGDECQQVLGEDVIVEISGVDYSINGQKVVKVESCVHTIQGMLVDVELVPADSSDYVCMGEWEDNGC